MIAGLVPGGPGPLPQSVAHQAGDEIGLQAPAGLGPLRVDAPHDVDLGGAGAGQGGHLLGQAMGLGGAQRGEGAAQVRQDRQEARLVQPGQGAGDRLEGVGGAQDEVGAGAHEAHEEVGQAPRVRPGAQVGDDGPGDLGPAQGSDGGGDAGGAAHEDRGGGSGPPQDVDLPRDRLAPGVRIGRRRPGARASRGRGVRAFRGVRVGRGPAQAHQQVAHAHERVDGVGGLVVLQPGGLGHELGQGGHAPAHHGARALRRAPRAQPAGALHQVHQAVQDLRERPQPAQVGQGRLQGVAHGPGQPGLAHDDQLDEQGSQRLGARLGPQALGQTRPDQGVEGGGPFGGAHELGLHRRGPGVGPLLDELPRARARHEVGAPGLPGEPRTDEAHGGQELAALAVAGLAGRVQGGAVLERVVEHEAHGRQAFADLGDQRRGAGAGGHLPRAGVGEDGGDRRAQVARQPRVVLDQARAQGVEQVGAPGPGASAQRRQSQGLLHGGLDLGGAQRLPEPAQGGGDVEHHPGGEVAPARPRLGAGPPGAPPQARGGHAGPVAAQGVQPGEVVADEPAPGTGARVGRGRVGRPRVGRLGGGVEGVEEGRGVEGAGDHDDRRVRGAGARPARPRTGQALEQGGGHDRLAGAGAVGLQDFGLGVQAGQARPGQGVGEEAAPVADVGGGPVLEELLPDLVVVAAAQPGREGVEGGGAGQVVLGLEGASARPRPGVVVGPKEGAAVDEGRLGAAGPRPPQGHPFGGELGQRVVGGGALAQGEHGDRRDGRRVLEGRQQVGVLGGPLDEDDGGADLLQQGGQGQGAGRGVVADGDQVHAPPPPGPLRLQGAGEPGWDGRGRARRRRPSRRRRRAHCAAPGPRPRRPHPHRSWEAERNSFQAAEERARSRTTEST